jgi:hypothetical protein
VAHRLKTRRPRIKAVCVSLTRNEDGRLKLAMSGQLPRNAMQRLFWLVDPKTQEYTVLRLIGDDDLDARRIVAAYGARGVVRVAEDFVAALRADRLSNEKRFEDGKDRAIRRSKPRAIERDDSDSHGPCAPEVNDETLPSARPTHGTQQTYSCQGYGYADVEIWEVAKVQGLPVDHLNETNVEVDWFHDIYGDFDINQGPSHYFSVSSWGECWANSQTFIGTYWQTGFCSGHQPTQYQYGFDVNKVGYYENVDFLPVLGLYLGVNLEAEFTQVVSSAAVQYTYGQANWGQTTDIYASATWLQWFEENFLLTGIVDGTAFEYNCVWHCDPDPQVVADCETGDGDEIAGWWDWETCQCIYGTSPIIIDLDSDGLSLTNALNGVQFDILVTGKPVSVAWTAAGADDSFLALDRNGNGTIDHGAELFGNLTPQPNTERKSGANGFLALAVFDQLATGGNNDGQISDADAVYPTLRLWKDTNHDGISQPDELRGLADVGVRSIALRYQVSQRMDEFGNVFRFRSHVAMDSSALSPGPLKRQAIDVFFRYLPVR